VTLVAAALAAGIVVNLIRGTDPFAFVALSWRWPALPFCCALLQVVNGLSELPGRTAVTMGTHVGVVGWLAMQMHHQRRRPASSTIGLGALLGGAALNTIPILRYGAMPVSARALAAIGADPGRNVARGQLGKHALMHNYGTVGWLGDILPIPYPVVRSVISIGDIAMAVGIVYLVLNRCGTLRSGSRNLGGSVHQR
jgi:Family of unknown function (DUF5317)